MSEERRTPAEWAQKESFGRTVQFGEIEQRLGMTTEPYRSWFKRQQVWQLTAFVFGLFVFAALATVDRGGEIPGVPGTSARDPMSSSSREVLLPLSFVLGLTGIVMFFVQWWRAGRRAVFYAYVVSVLALITCAALALRYSPEELGTHVFVLMGITAVSAFALLVVEACFSRPGQVPALCFIRLEEELRRLPESRQNELLAERAEMLGIMVDRRVLHTRDAAKLRAMPLGSFWTVEKRFKRAARAEGR